MGFNINAERAKRQAATGENFEFEVDGEKFTIPIEMDVEVLAELRSQDAGDVKATLGTLIGPEQAERLFKHKLYVQDFKALMEAHKDASGLSVGEGSDSAT